MKSYAAIALTLFGLASASPAAPVHARQDGEPPPGCSAFPYPQIEFTNEFPSQICIGQTYDFSWTGGSGKYKLLQELLLPGFPTSHPGNLLVNSTETTYSWTAPTGDGPETKWWFYIQDATSQPDRCDKWWDTSDKIPIVEC